MLQRQENRESGLTLQEDLHELAKYLRVRYSLPLGPTNKVMNSLSRRLISAPEEIKPVLKAELDQMIPPDFAQKFRERLTSINGYYHIIPKGERWWVDK